MTIPHLPRRPATRTPLSSILPFLALTSALIWSTPAASAGTTAPLDGNGVDGFAICGTFDPTSSFYVPDDPVYLSDIFQVWRNSPNYELAFKNFLRQKYGWNKYVTCSVSYTRDGATKTFNERLKQAGAHLVRTGWTLASGGASAGTDAAAGAGSAAAPAAPSDPAAGSSYWVCRVSGSNGKDYSSEIFRGSDGGFSTFAGLFGQFVQSTYNVKFLSPPTCTDYGVQGRHQAIEALQGYASYSTGVMTGWKYGMAGAPSSASSQPAAAPAHSVPSAGGVMYWVCSWAYGGSFYVSDAFGADYPAVGPGELAPAFQNFVVAKYGAKPYGGSCVYKFSKADADALLKHELSAPPSGTKAVATGWRYGMTASAASSPAAGAAAAVAPQAAPAPPTAPAQNEQGPPVAAHITVRLVDGVHASSDQPNKHYRAVVTQAVTAGRVQIPVNTLAAITVAQQSPGNFSTQLVSLKIDGQDTPVTSTPLNATSATQDVAKKIGGFLASIRKPGMAAPASAIESAGNHAAIAPGTTLTFYTSIPQPAASPANAVPVAQPPMPASAGAQQGSGELGPDGQVMGGTVSGVMTAYSCSVQTIPQGQHRQTTYITAPFSSAQPQQWITFWFSQYIHQTYNIPANIARFTIGCGSLGNRTPVQQQAVVNANITSWKQHDNDVVQLHWAPTQTPTPGISVSQLNPMTGEMTTGGIGSNMPPPTNPAGSVVLCGLPTLKGNEEYLSAVFPAGNHQHVDFETAFENYASTTYNSGKVLGTASCLIVTQAHAQAMLQQWRKDFQNVGTHVVDTGWTYKGPEAGPVATAQPTPPGYVLCTTNRSSDSKAYTSAIFRGSNDQQLAMGQAFLTYMATNFGPNVPHNTSCVAYQDRADAQRYLSAMKNQAPGAGITVVETGWTYSGAAP